MDAFLLGVVSGFLLFAVILPLLGVVIGLFCYYVVPYALMGLVSLGLLVFAGVKILFTWWLLLLALLWASAVCLVKFKFHKIGENIEHYRAAHATLLCGAPYRRRRNELLQVCADVEV